METKNIIPSIREMICPSGTNKSIYPFSELKSPNWQRKRLEILQRDNFTCQRCGDNKNSLHIHHRYYIKELKLWEYPDDSLTTLCEYCHQTEKKEYSNFVECFNYIKSNFFSYNIYFLQEFLEMLSHDNSLEGIIYRLCNLDGKEFENILKYINKTIEKHDIKEAKRISKLPYVDNLPF